MATTKQVVVRLAKEDLDILAAVQRESGHVTTSDVIRYVIRQYAKTQGIAVAAPKSSKRK